MPATQALLLGAARRAGPVACRGRPGPDLRLPECALRLGRRHWRRHQGHLEHQLHQLPQFARLRPAGGRRLRRGELPRRFRFQLRRHRLQLDPGHVQRHAPVRSGCRLPPGLHAPGTADHRRAGFRRHGGRQLCPGAAERPADRLLARHRCRPGGHRHQSLRRLLRAEGHGAQQAPGDHLEQRLPLRPERPIQLPGHPAHPSPANT